MHFVAWHDVLVSFLTVSTWWQCRQPCSGSMLHQDAVMHADTYSISPVLAAFFHLILKFFKYVICTHLKAPLLVQWEGSLSCCPTNLASSSVITDLTSNSNNVKTENTWIMIVPSQTLTAGQVVDNSTYWEWSIANSSTVSSPRL